MRKWLSLTLALALCMSLCAIPAAADGAAGKPERQTISLGGGHGLAIKEDGSLWAWGSNCVGQLGNGGKGNAKDTYGGAIQTVPVKIMDGVAAAYAGGQESGILKTDGTFWLCGFNLGVLAYEERKEDDLLTPVKLLDNVVSASLDTGRGFAVKKDGSLWGWGINGLGQVMPGSPTVDYYKEPVKIMDGVRSVSAGGASAFAVKTDGSLWSWGSNGCCALGVGQVVRDADAPFRVMDSVTAMCGDRHSLAVREDGSLWTWGWNYSKILGIDLDSDSCPTPTRVTAVTDVLAVSVAGGNSLALKADGSLWAWGNNVVGQLGNGGVGDYQFADEFGELLYQTKPVKIMDGVETYGARPIAPAPPEAPAGSAKFSDVKQGSSFDAAIGWAVEQGITNGTSKTTFSPDNTCTHNHILTFIWRANGAPAASGDKDFEKAVNWAKANGIADEVTGGEGCTRAQAMMYLWKLANSPKPAQAAAFGDVDASAPYADAVAWAVEQGITNGTSAEAFSPDRICTRGQIVTFLYRSLTK